MGEGAGGVGFSARNEHKRAHLHNFKAAARLALRRFRTVTILRIIGARRFCRAPYRKRVVSDVLRTLDSKGFR